jgi:hypothetical protein
MSVDDEELLALHGVGPRTIRILHKKPRNLKGRLTDTALPPAPNGRHYVTVTF